jgi:MFS family permease
MEKIEEPKELSRFILIQTIVIGILWAADRTFFFFEQNFFNTYLDHVLGLPEIYISVMVSLSAVVGLVMNFTWGIISDNTRLSIGRRRPFFLFAILSGIGMILYGLSPNYITCLILDVLLIGITSNAVSVASRAIIPDTIDLERRGRANGIIQAISYVGLIIALAFFLMGNELFGVPGPQGETIISQEGHFILLSIGGIIYAGSGLVGFAFIREKPVPESMPKKKFMDDLREVLKLEEIKEQKEFFKVTLAATVFQMGVASVMPFLFLYIFDLGLSTLNLLIAILVGFVVLFPAVIYIGNLADKYGRKQFLPLIFIIVSIGYILVPLVNLGGGVNFILFVVLIPFVLLGLLGLETVINTWAQDTLPKGKEAKYYGIFNIVFTISQIVGSFAGGIAAQLYGRQYIFIAGAIFFLISIPFFAIVKETLKTKE